MHVLYLSLAHPHNTVTLSSSPGLLLPYVTFRAYDSVNNALLPGLHSYSSRVSTNNSAFPVSESKFQLPNILSVLPL